MTDKELSKCLEIEAERDLAKIEIERLLAINKELCGAMRDVMCWYSSGFAPQSQAMATERANKAMAAAEAAYEQTASNP